MFKKWGNIFIAVLLSVLITAVSGPHELLHSFSHHQDTIDRVDVQNHGLEKRFETKHIHCDYLNYTFSHFVFSPTFYFHWISKISSFQFVNSYFSINSNTSIHYYLRGPPINNLIIDGLV